VGEAAPEADTLNGIRCAAERPHKDVRAGAKIHGRLLA